MQFTKARGSIDLLHGSIFKSLLLFSIPFIISMLFQQLYNTVDTLVVGKFVGKEALAAGRTSDAKANISFTKLFPWFILGFLAMAALNSCGVIPGAVSAAMKDLSKFLMVCALAAIGLNTSFAQMRKSGAAPMLHGFIISLLVVLVAIAVEYVIGVAPNGGLF